jgi:hypothetical protein
MTIFVRMKEELLVLKKTVFDSCFEQLENKKLMLKEELLSLSNSSQNESKSSMGDKYETSREMISQEMERVLKQLNLVDADLSKLTKLSTVERYTTVCEGSLLVSGKHIFFVGYGAGKLNTVNQEVFAISSDSPFAKSIVGKKEGDPFTFMNQMFKIEHIC